MLLLLPLSPLMDDGFLWVFWFFDQSPKGPPGERPIRQGKGLTLFGA